VRVLVTAFLLGAAAAGALALVIAVAASILAEASGRDALRVALLGVDLVTFERAPNGSSTTFGPGLAFLALVGGLANAIGAAAIRRARGPEP
jgi:hypothetical protein